MNFFLSIDVLVSATTRFIARKAERVLVAVGQDGTVNVHFKMPSYNSNIGGCSRFQYGGYPYNYIKPGVKRRVHIDVKLKYGL